MAKGADSAGCRVHGTAVAVDGGRAALILGPSGAGKSDLAMRLVTQPYRVGGRQVTLSLVADDQVLVEREGDRVFVAAPVTIAGRLEVRGLGVVSLPFAPRAELALCVRLRPAAEIERLPDPLPRHALLGRDLPLIEVDPATAGAPGRVLLALLDAGVP